MWPTWVQIHTFLTGFPHVHMNCTCDHMAFWGDLHVTEQKINCVTHAVMCYTCVLYVIYVCFPSGILQNRHVFHIDHMCFTCETHPVFP